MLNSRSAHVVGIVKGSHSPSLIYFMENVIGGTGTHRGGQKQPNFEVDSNRKLWQGNLPVGVTNCL